MDVAHVAKLANLPLKPGEEETFQPQLEKILDYVSQLQKIDTSNVIPTSQVTGKDNATRDDQTTSSLQLDKDYFKVSAIFDND